VTSTITNPAISSAAKPTTKPATSTIATGTTSTRQVALAYLTTATAETAVGVRVRSLLGELREVAADRQMAGLFVEPGSWRDELDREERDVWDHIAEALTPVSSANIKEEQ
jgi:hypothetical protein